MVIAWMNSFGLRPHQRSDAQPNAPEPVPGYRPLTAHAMPARVPALLGGNPHRKR